MQRMLKLINDYVKRTKFGRTNKVNLAGLNSADTLMMVFEEFIQSFNCFFLEPDYGNALIDIAAKILKG
jgi:hypothetical protein